MRINELQRRALLALMDVETARVAVDRTTRRTAQHQLYALIRERYGCKYSCLPADRWKEVVIWLVEGPLTSGGEVAIYRERGGECCQHPPPRGHVPRE